ncbi:DUF2793 domain-containing protein [Alteriqipengyuania lutimaris]|uniref:DUF2793 domain-containing protein n=1 Tax=Alteriqipengyuania lutimaris TaxID=1538146 RepID=A0A395LI77_9SPHN|nr:DUF2793 domain-containing protein [Alteriqipengyuania lutimaris]MBB3034532.1 hypothetical protein [Alteriqipengyuania lutimaris]RDS76582.1 DUF2793 domain-containing protein [Alteriqipengyuania lutimaris]
MTTPLTFTGRTAHADLPFLFAGQAQKEASVNEALARIDALLSPSVEGEASMPPADPADGEGWIVGPSAQGLWDGRDTQLAFHAAGTWLFAVPREGQRVFDRSSGCLRVWRDGWLALVLPPAPEGGALVDTEARAALAALVEGLRSTGWGS